MYVVHGVFLAFWLAGHCWLVLIIVKKNTAGWQVASSPN
jgi:hypothetical protein